MVLLELQAAVATCPRFCFFVQVYVHLGVAQGTTASIAGYDAVLHLIHRLLCYQINGKVLIHLFLFSALAGSVLEERKRDRGLHLF